MLLLQDEMFKRSSKAGAKFSSAAKKEIADFKRKYHQNRWDIDFVGSQVRVLCACG